MEVSCLQFGRSTQSNVRWNLARFFSAPLVPRLSALSHWMVTQPWYETSQAQPLVDLFGSKNGVHDNRRTWLVFDSEGCGSLSVVLWPIKIRQWPPTRRAWWIASLIASPWYNVTCTYQSRSTGGTEFPLLLLYACCSYFLDMPEWTVLTFRTFWGLTCPAAVLYIVLRLKLQLSCDISTSLHAMPWLQWLLKAIWIIRQLLVRLPWSPLTWSIQNRRLRSKFPRMMHRSGKPTAPFC